MLTFEAGKTYSTPSVCNNDCIFTFILLKRSKCFGTFKTNARSNPVRVKIHKDSRFGQQDAEYCYPLGTSSMCPVIDATD